MKLTTLTLFRTVALLSCALMLAVALAGGLSAGPASVLKDAAANRTVAMLALQLAGMFGDTAANRMTTGLWLYPGLLVLAFSLFALAFLARTSPHIKRTVALDAGLLTAQILIGALVETDLLYLVAAELAFALPHRTALLWLCAQMLVFIASTIPILLHAGVGTPRCNVGGVFPPSALAAMSLDWIEEIAFQIFAFCVGYLAGTEMRSRLTLAAAHAELATAQVLLADAVRASEQVRIACRLHDAIGHHLAALNLQLDLALRQVGSHANESVQTARALAQRLLAEVRIVVGSERAQQDFNLRQALETLCAGIPAPRIALSCDDRLELHSPTLTHTLFCAVQEAISNTVRHAGAKVMHIVLSNGNEGLTISISDDGKGLPTMAALHAGNGLRGMRERIEAHGGTLEAANRPEGGFGMQIRLPQSGDAQ